MAISTGRITPFLTRDLNEVHVVALKRRLVYWPLVMRRETMQTNPVRSRLAGQLAPVGRKFELEPYDVLDPEIGAEIERFARGYGGSIVLSFEARRDDQYDYAISLKEALMEALIDRMEIEGHALLINGGSAAFMAGYNGLPLFSNAHTTLTAGVTWANVPVDAAGNEILTDLSIDGLNAMLLSFMRTISEEGQPRVRMPQRVVLSSPDATVWQELGGSVLNPENASNAINPHLEFNYMKNGVIDPYITDGSWFGFGGFGATETDIRFGIRTDIRSRTWEDENIDAIKHATSVHILPYWNDQRGAFRGDDGS